MEVGIAGLVNCNDSVLFIYWKLDEYSVDDYSKLRTMEFCLFKKYVFECMFACLWVIWQKFVAHKIEITSLTFLGC